MSCSGTQCIWSDSCCRETSCWFSLVTRIRAPAGGTIPASPLSLGGETDVYVVHVMRNVTSLTLSASWVLPSAARKQRDVASQTITPPGSYMAFCSAHRNTLHTAVTCSLRRHHCRPRMTGLRNEPHVSLRSGQRSSFDRSFASALPSTS